MPLYLVKKIWIWTCRHGSSQYNLKKMLRSVLTLGIMLIFIVYPPLAQAIGEFNTFSAVMAMAFPCFLPFSVHVFIVMSLLLMLLASWAWICIATAAGFAARSPALLAKQLQTSSIPDVSPKQATAILVMSGHYLDTRCSLVFGIVLLFSTFCMGLGIAHKREMTLQLYFSLIVISMMFFINPLVPEPLYSGPESSVKAIAIYAAISSATYILVFPESFMHVWMKKTQQEIFLPIIASLGKNTSFQRDEVIAQLDDMIDLFRTEKGMISLEFAVNRLSPEEFSSLYGLVHGVVVKVRYLYLSQGPACRVEVTKDLKYDESLRTLQDFADDVQNSCRFSLISIHDWFYASTKYSWRSVFTGLDHDKVAFGLQGLETARDNLLHARKALQSHTSQFHDAIPNLTPSGTMTAIFSSLDNLDLLATEILSLLDFLISVDRREPPFRLWSPQVLSNVRTRAATASLSPGKATSMTSLSILARGHVQFNGVCVTRWMSDPRTIFAFRMALVSAGLFLLGVCETTASFYAQHGGVGAMILAQSYLTIYAGDQFRFWVIRMGATLLSLSFSALLWFIIAGEGNGNLYIFIIVTILFSLPAILLSVSTWKFTHMLFGILYSITMVATLTTLWNKAQEVPFSRNDLLTVVGERLAIDALGFAASTLAILLPLGPITARRGFHDLLAESVDLVHVGIVRTITASTPKSAASVSTSADKSRDQVQSESLSNAMTKANGDNNTSLDGLQHHQLMRDLLLSMNFEPRIIALPKTTYGQIFEAHARLISSITLYTGALQRLNIHPQQRKHLESRIPGLNASMVDKVLHGIEHLVRSARRRYHDVGPEFVPALAPVRPGLVRSPRVLVRLKRLYSVLDRTDPWQHPEEGAVPPRDAIYDSTTMPTLQDHIEFFHSYAELQLGIGLGIKYAPLGSGDILALATVVWHFSSIVKEVDTINRLLDNMD